VLRRVPRAACAVLAVAVACGALGCGADEEGGGGDGGPTAEQQVRTVVAKFGISTIQDPNHPAEITHNLRTFLIGADGRIAKIYSGSDWTPGVVLADLRALVSSK